MLDRKDAGERVHTEHGDEPGGVLTGVGRVGEGDVVLPAMESYREPERVDLVDGRAVLHRERLDVGLEAREREAVQLDEVGRRRAARQRLEAERPRAREQVEHPGAAERALQDREPRLPYTVPGRADFVGRGRLEAPPTETRSPAARPTRRPTESAGGSSPRVSRRRRARPALRTPVPGCPGRTAPGSGSASPGLR